MNEPKQMITGAALAKQRAPLIGHIHMGYKMVKCPKCSEVKKLKEVEITGKCPKCGTTYRKDARGISFYTQAVNHFVIDGLNKADEQAVIDYYGTDKPTQLHIKFLNPDITKVLNAGYRVYNNKRQAICRLDLYPVDKGITAQRAVPVYEVVDKKFKTVYSALDRKAANNYIEDFEKKTKTKSDLIVIEVLKTYEDIECQKEKCPYLIEGKCKFVATFDFSLAMVGRQVGGWRLATSSAESFHNIAYVYNAIAGTFGNKLPFYNFLLELYPKEKLVDGKFKKKVYLLKLNYEESLHKLLDEQKKLFGIGLDVAPAALAAPSTPPSPALVLDAGPDYVPEYIVGEHADNSDVIEDADQKDVKKKDDEGAADSGVKQTASPTGTSGAAAKSLPKAVAVTIKDIEPFFKDVKNKALIISNNEMADIYKKLGVKAGTKVSAVAKEKLPSLLTELKALVEKKKATSEVIPVSKKEGPMF